MTEPRIERDDDDVIVYAESVLAFTHDTLVALLLAVVHGVHCGRVVFDLRGCDVSLTTTAALQLALDLKKSLREEGIEVCVACPTESVHCLLRMTAIGSVLPIIVRKEFASVL